MYKIGLSSNFKNNIKAIVKIFNENLGLFLFHYL